MVPHHWRKLLLAVCQNGSIEWSLSTSISTFLALTCIKFLSLPCIPGTMTPTIFWFVSDLLSEIIMILGGHVSLIECLKWVCLNVVAPNLMLHHQFPVFQHSYVGMSRIPPPFSEHPTSQDLCFANHWHSNPGPTSSHIVFFWSASLRFCFLVYFSDISCQLLVGHPWSSFQHRLWGDVPCVNKSLGRRWRGMSWSFHSGSGHRMPLWSSLKLWNHSHFFLGSIVIETAWWFGTWLFWLSIYWE